MLRLKFLYYEELIQHPHNELITSAFDLFHVLFCVVDVVFIFHSVFPTHISLTAFLSPVRRVKPHLNFLTHAPITHKSVSRQKWVHPQCSLLQNACRSLYSASEAAVRAAFSHHVSPEDRRE